MQTGDFILDTLAHSVRQDEGPPPGIPAHVKPEFEQELTWLCEWHSVTPIIVASLEELALGPQLSRITFERMRALARASGALSGELLATLADLSRELAKRGTDVLWMDDAVYPLSVYENRGLRPVESIDMLIREEDWPTVIGVCQSAGFERNVDEPRVTSGAEAGVFYQYFPACELLGEKGDRVVVKFRVFDVGKPEGTERAWDHAVKAAVDDVSVRHLGYEDQLIRACIMYTVSRFSRLLYAVDIGVILKRHGRSLDWSYFEERLRARSVYSAVFFSIQHATRLLKLGDWTQRLENPGSLRRSVFFSLWNPPGVNLAAGQRTTRYDRLRFHLLETGTLAERVRFLWRLVSPKREWVSSFSGKPYRPWHKPRFVFRMLRTRTGARPT